MNKIKEVFVTPGGTQQRFASQMEKTENTISLWFKNKVQLRLDDVFKAANILDVQIVELLKTKGEIDE